MEVRNLEQIGLEKLLSVINLAFSDCIVPLKWTLEILKSKIESEDVKLTLSTGAFDADKMVAYVYNVDHTADSTLGFLKSMGLREKIAQFEMSRMCN